MGRRRAHDLRAPRARGGRALLGHQLRTHPLRAPRPGGSRTRSGCGRACDPAIAWSGVGRGHGRPDGIGWIGWIGWVDPGGACVVAAVAVAIRAGPLEHPGRDHPVVPGGVGLEPVVEPTQGAKVLGAGRAGLGSAFGFGVVVVLDDVVDVAATGWPGAPREDAGAVAENHVVADPVGDRIARRFEGGGEVDDGLDGDLGPGVAAPGLDLVEQHQALAFLEPADGTEHRRLAVSRSGEVGVEHDLPGRGQAVGRSTAGSSALPVARPLGVGDRGRSGCGRGCRGPWPGVRRGDSVEPRAFWTSASWASARSRSSPSARSRSASKWRVPA